MVKSLEDHLKNQIKKYPELTIVERNNLKQLYCGFCSAHLKWDSQYGSNRIKSHCNGKSHKESLIKKKQRNDTIKNAFNKAGKSFNAKKNFKMFLTQMLIECDIPLYKADHKSFKRLIEEISDKKVPHSITLRVQIEVFYYLTIEKIRKAVGDDDIYLIIDETTDCKTRKVCNVIVGVMNGTDQRPMLLCVKFLQEVNNETICQTINEACNLLWNGKIQYKKLLLVVTHQARYMLLAIKNLKLTNMYPNLHHITCIAHTLHRVCEKIRLHNLLANKLIGDVKNVLQNSNSRKIKFVQSTGLPLPPDVVLTRWGTWLNAAFYC